MSFVCDQIEPSSATDLMDKIGTALVAMGWTLHDTVSATNKVYSSDGEGADRITEYIWFNVSGNDVQFRAYNYWDAATDTGSCGAYYHSTTYSRLIYAASQVWIISGSKDLVMMAKRGGTAYTDVVMFGHIPHRAYETPLGILQNNEGAGAGVVVELDNVTDFKANKTYQIVGATGEGRDNVIVTAVDAGATTVTISNLPRNYNAGSMIGACPSTFGITSGESGVRTKFLPTCYWGVAGTGATTIDQYWTYGTAMITVAQLDPDNRLGQGAGTVGLYVLQPLAFIEYTQLSLIGFCDANILKCPTTTMDTLFGVNQLDTGTATAGGATSLTCAGKSWTVDAYIGKVVIITGGLGIGQTRVISDNDATVLTVGEAWDTNPNATSTFMIADEAWRDISTLISGIAYKEMIP